MTRASEILGPEFDLPATLPCSLRPLDGKRDIVLARLRRAETEEDAEAVELCYWELGLADLLMAPHEGTSPYQAGEFAPYAEFYHFTPATLDYARARVAETQDVVLELHYLQFVRLQGPQKGREWIDCQRTLLAAYRRFIHGCVSGAPRAEHDFRGLEIESALRACAPLLGKAGVLTPGEAEDWARYLVHLAEVSREFPVDREERRPHMRHRWVSPYLLNLTALPLAASSPELRGRAMALLQDAASYYATEPLNDHFVRAVADDNAAIRKYWGEKGTHEQSVRTQYDALIRRAEFHKKTGNGMLTAHFFGEARALVERHRNLFDSEVVARLEVLTQTALHHSVEAGEYAEIRVNMEIPRELLDFVKETPEATAAALVAEAVAGIPDRASIGDQIDAINQEAPLQAILPRSIIGAGKVVGQSVTSEGNRDLDIEQEAMRATRLLGAAMSFSCIKGRTEVGLTAEHLVMPLDTLSLDAGTRALLVAGCERLLVEDWIAAAHILVLRIEDVLRQQLRALGVDTTRYVPDVGDGTSRTDDAPLGTLMRKGLPDGRSVEAYLGSDLWHHIDSVLNSQTGLNLRNDFAHGLARPASCTPEVVGLVLALLYQIGSAMKLA